MKTSTFKELQQLQLKLWLICNEEFCKREKQKKKKEEKKKLKEIQNGKESEIHG